MDGAVSEVDRFRAVAALVGFRDLERVPRFPEVPERGLHVRLIGAHTAGDESATKCENQEKGGDDETTSHGSSSFSLVAHWTRPGCSRLRGLRYPTHPCIKHT